MTPLAVAATRTCESPKSGLPEQKRALKGRIGQFSAFPRICFMRCVKTYAKLPLI